jgi:hypothetical protein
MQLSTQYPQDLNSIFGQFSMIPALSALQQTQNANTNDQQNLQQAQEDLRHSQAFNPLHEAGQALSNQSLQAQIPGQIAQSTLMGNKATLDSATLPQQLEAAKSKIALEVDDNKLKTIENHGQKLSYFGGLAASNGGVIPLDLQAQMPDDVRQIIAQQGGAKAKAIGDMMLSAAQQRQATRERESMITGRETAVQQMRDDTQAFTTAQNIDAGKFRNHSDSYLMFKAETSKDLNAQAAVEDYKKEQALQRAKDFPQGSQEYKQAIEEATGRAQRADALRAQETANRAAAANTTNQPRLDLPALSNTTRTPQINPAAPVNGTSGVVPAAQQARQAPQLPPGVTIIK